MSVSRVILSFHAFNLKSSCSVISCQAERLTRMYLHSRCPGQQPLRVLCDLFYFFHFVFVFAYAGA